MKLDVYVRGHKVGVLEQTDIASYVFSYLPDVPAELAISLLMPPRTKSWEAPYLFPVFEVSLPEGALRHTLERSFAKYVDHFDDMTLLSLVGSNLVGQLQVVPVGQPPRRRSLSQSLQSLLSDDLKSLVAFYLGEGDESPGVSGGFLKLLARSPTDPKDGINRTLALNDWIIKLNDPERPTIVLLEYFGMMAARQMGLPTPVTHLAPDFSRLLLRRFDIADNGEPLAFEDMCALMALPARLKFSGSVERIIRTIRTFCPTKEAQRSLERFYGQYLLANTIRNGDAHLKNFGLVYGTDRAPTLSPVYDMLSMAVYAPRNDDGDAMDAMALTFGGTTRWLKDPELKKLGTACGLSPAVQVQYRKRMARALIDTADSVMAFLKEHPESGFAPAAARMLELWTHGMMTVDPAAAAELRAKGIAN